MKTAAALFLSLAASIAFSGAASAQSSSPAAASAAGSRMDPAAATAAYLASVPPEQKARSDAYFEGGYWLLLWDFLAGALLSFFLLKTRLSARVRDLAERIARAKPLQTGIYWALYLFLTSAVFFPLTVYEGYFREHRYGLANQSFGPWMGDQIKGLAVALVFGGLAVIVLYGVLRRAPKTWWLWGSLTAMLLLVLGEIVAPIYVAPLFNTYKKLEDPRVREPILSLARANGITARDVYEQDASRQSKRVSAFVNGFLGTERITLNDNLLNRCTLPEIEAVMGHEIGHYVMHHVYKGILFFGVLIVAGFAAVRWAFNRIVAAKGAAWGVSGVGDVAGLPLFVLLISTYFFLLTPVTNTYIRTQEAEADLFGLNAAREPDAEAKVDLMLGEYRKLDPGRVEEFLFFDHPSGRSRILMAMRWKAEQGK
jgi:Zn-dependent protease with chaperone function